MPQIEETNVPKMTQTKLVTPPEVQGGIRQILTLNLSEQEARRSYPNVFSWFAENLDLIAMMQDSGIELQPLCGERPDILVGAGCPSCGSTVGVRSDRRRRT